MIPMDAELELVAAAVFSEPDDVLRCELSSRWITTPELSRALDVVLEYARTADGPMGMSTLRTKLHVVDSELLDSKPIRELSVMSQADELSKVAEDARELFHRRELEEFAQRISRLAKTKGAHAAQEKIIEQASRDLSGGESTEVSSTIDMIDGAYKRAIEREVRPPVNLGALRKTLGVQFSGSLTVIGGDTNAGKSQLMAYMAERFTSSGRRAGVISLEDGMDTMGSRAAMMFGFPSIIGEGKQELEKQRAVLIPKLREKLQSESMYTHLPNPTLEHATRAMRRLVYDEKCEILFVDYLQAMVGDIEGTMRGVRNDQLNRERIRVMKTAAYNLSVPLIMGSQLSRWKNGSTRKPSKNHLRDGGIEHAAENILVLWRPETDAESTYGVVDKLKNGCPGDMVRLVRGKSGMVLDVTFDAPPEKSEVAAWS